MFRNKKFNAHPFPYHHELEIEITALTNLGLGLGRVILPPNPTDAPSENIESASGGWVVMVAAALPGERVRVRIFRNHKNYSEADLLEVLRASKDRVDPRCALFGQCGGCQYQNLAHSAQLEWKQKHVAELLKHMVKIDFPVRTVVASPKEYGYRSKLTPHFNTPREGEPLAIGFLRHGTRHSVLDVPTCPIATDAINAALAAERARVLEKREGFESGATLLFREALEGVVTDPSAQITEEVEGVKLRFLARDFFQNNPFILPAFTKHVREQAAADGVRFLVDAYCGSGLFALTAARAFERVVGVEISASAVKWAQENAATNGIANAQFSVGDATTIFANLPFGGEQSAVVIDPPRRGCDESFLRQLVEFAPARIVYVSCDPATQMRDLGVLLPAGYELVEVQPFDLFPQTRHLECVITLRRLT